MAGWVVLVHGLGDGHGQPPTGKGHEHINFDNGLLTWVDATFQALLSAKILLQIATLLGRQAEVEDLRQEYGRLKDHSNQFLWNAATKFYYDRQPDGELLAMKHIGSYWALLAGIVPADRLPDFVAHLENPAEFNRAHRVPALSADSEGYSGTGGYWCGGIWAPTNYMVLKGLEANGQTGLAHAIAKNHLENVVKVLNQKISAGRAPSSFRQYFHLTELNYDDKHTLWENYAPDIIRPGSHSKPGYVGWTGIPPIAVLFEDVFGLTQDAVSNRLTWHVWLTEEHGVRRYPFGSTGMLDLMCISRNSPLDSPSFEIHSNIPFTLDVIWEGGTKTLNVEKDL